MVDTRLTQGLNPRQKEAVENLEGPLLILAGAGSGKTRVLTHRIAALVSTGLARADEILAVTFTNKAAREMRERTEHLLASFGLHAERDLWVSTFHSSCVRILRGHIHLLGYPSFFGIYDSADQLSVLKKVLGKLNLDDKVHPAKGFQSRISHAKMLGILPEDLEAGRSPHFRLDATSLNVYKEYQAEMQRSQNLDFDDLLLKTYELFRDYPVVLENYQKRFKYILIDEYQDTNHIQYKLISLLAQAHKNLCVVGDEDQSIYSWRGADISNILSFEKDFPSAKVIKLEQNYRSTQTIVDAASHLIRNNTQRKDKVLFTHNDQGAKIIIQEEGNEYDEARFVVKSIQKAMDAGDLNYADFAVFYRTNAQSRVLEEQLRTNSIPYRLIGGLKFYERMEIKDVLGYMKLAINPADDVAFRRVINTPTRGIGKTTIEQLEYLASTAQKPMLTVALEAAQQREFNSGVCKKLNAFCNMMAEISAQAAKVSPSELYHVILDKTQYVVRLKEENTTEAQARIENLEELDNAIVQFEKERADQVSTHSFLEEMALVSDIDTMEDNAATVTLMTLHISKGLEFPYVYIVGLEEGIFPTTRALDRFEPDALEEERRLAYVGMTRARQHLTVSYCRHRRLWGAEQHNPPSRFLKELPENLVEYRTNIARPQFVEKYRHFSDPTSVSRNSYAKESFDEFGDTSWGHSDDSDHDSTEIGPAGLRKGMRVRHPTYGVGSIYECEGSGDAQKVSVLFDDRSLKKFVVKYARLEPV